MRRRPADPAAAFEIGTRFAEGKGVARDLSQAALWYQRAADAGLAPAEYRLGSLYERGQGVAKDQARAVALYQRAAKQGNIGAMHNLAVLVSEGAAGAPDREDGAVVVRSPPANYGVKDSQYNLGVVYARGIGTKENLPEAYKWFAIAAAAGDKDAAGRRDEVAALLNQDQLALARAAVKAWRPKAPPADANTVTLPAGGWGAAAPGRDRAMTRKRWSRRSRRCSPSRATIPGPADGVAGAEDPRCGARLPGECRPRRHRTNRPLAGHRARRSDRLRREPRDLPPLALTAKGVRRFIDCSPRATATRVPEPDPTGVPTCSSTSP